jgi:hypothetical protein
MVPATGFLTLRAGTFQRTTRAEREGAHRGINISNCPVTRWDVIGHDIGDKLDGHSFRADEALMVSIMEAKPGDVLWEEDPEKIGALVTDSMHANVRLPPDAFALFWIAAEAADGATRFIEIVSKPDRPDVLTVTNIGLFENMPGSPVHPVVAELRVMREKLSRLVTSIAVVLLIVWVLQNIFRHL